MVTCLTMYLSMYLSTQCETPHGPWRPPGARHQGRCCPAGTPPASRGFASLLSPRLNNANLANSPARPGNARPCEGVRPPLAALPALDARALAIHPRRRPGFRIRRSVCETRDQPKDAPRFALGSGTETCLLLWVGLGFLRHPRRRRLKQGCFAGAQQPFVTAWGQSR